MGVKIKKHFELLKLYGKMDLAMLLRDTKFALLNLLADTVSNISAITGIFLLAWRFDGIGDMNKHEVLFMLAYITIVTGVYQAFCSMNNVGHISRRIGRGQLEHMMLQPLSFKTQLFTEGFIPFTGSGNLIIGFALLTYTIHELGLIITWWWVLSLVANILITIAIILSQSYLFSSAAFYAPVSAEEISTYVIDLGGDLSKYPLSGMPKAVQIPLLSIFPSGLLGWFPTMVLLGKDTLGLPEYFPLIILLILFILARFLFKKGLKHYVRTGSNRYLPHGHRR